MEISDDDLKIKVYLKDKNNLFANVTISVQTVGYDFLTVKDFQIWKSNNLNERLQEYINITPPTKVIFGRYIPRVFLEKKEKWFELETRIYDAYLKAKNKSQNNKEENLEDIKEDDINF